MYIYSYIKIQNQFPSNSLNSRSPIFCVFSYFHNRQIIAVYTIFFTRTAMQKKGCFVSGGSSVILYLFRIFGTQTGVPHQSIRYLFSFLSFALCSLLHFLYLLFRETSFQCHSLLGKDKQTKSGRLMTCFSVKKQSAFKEFDLLFKTPEIIKCLLTKQNT